MLMNALTHSQWHQNLSTRITENFTEFNCDTYRKFNMKVHSGRCCIAFGDDTSLSNWCIFQLRFTTKIGAFILTAHLSNAFWEHDAYKKIVETNVGERKLIIKLFLQFTYRVIQEQTGRCLHTCVNNVGEKKTHKVL